MTETVLASQGWSFSLLDALLGFIRRRSEQRHAPTSVRPLPPDVRLVGDVLLGAQNLQELKDLASEAARLPTPISGQDVAQLVERLDAHQDIDLADAGLAEVFGEGPCATATTGMRMLVGVLKIVRSLGVIDAGASGAVPVVPPDVLHELAYDTSIPAEQRLALLRIGTMSPAAYAMARAIERGTRVDPWCAKAIADLFAEGVLALAAMVSTLTAGAAPERETLREAVVERWAAEARESGLDVYFPFGDPDAVAG